MLYSNDVFVVVLFLLGELHVVRELAQTKFIMSLLAVMCANKPCGITNSAVTYNALTDTDYQYKIINIPDRSAADSRRPLRFSRKRLANRTTQFLFDNAPCGFLSLVSFFLFLFAALCSMRNKIPPAKPVVFHMRAKP